jgi:hypothetical protein
MTSFILLKRFTLLAFVALCANASLFADISVTITDNTQGRAFTVAGAGCAPGGYLTPQVLQWTPGSSCTFTFVSPNSVQSGTQYLFTGWQDGVNANPRTVSVPLQATVYSASFSTQYFLTLLASPTLGGTVTGGGWINAGGSATITATAATGYRFVGWTGNGYSSGLPTTSSGTVSPVYGTSTATAVFAPVTNALPTNYTVLPIVSNAGTTGPKPINSSGQVAALSFSYPTISAVRWLPSSVNGTVGSLQDLGTLPLTGWSGTTSINDAGQIAGLNGANYPSVGKIVIWTPTAGGGGNVAIIADAQGSPALNNYGQAGASGLIWTPVSANAGTGTLTTGSQFTNLIAMNGFGQAVLNPTGYPAISASLFTPSSAHGTAGTFTSITGLAGSSQTSLVAINENGAVLGYSCFSQLNGNCLNQAFLWIPASTNSTSGVISQIALPNGFVSMTPAAINDNGDVVGTMLQTSGTAVPFLYSKGNVYDLTTASALLVGASATGINNSGQIVLNGNAVYLATPEPTMPIPPANAVSVTITDNTQGRAFTVAGAGCAPGGYLTPQVLQWTPGSSCTFTFVSPNSVQSGTQYLFTGWQDGVNANPRTVSVPLQATVYSASFSTQYFLTLLASPTLGGTVTGGGWINAGGSATITATAATGYRFVGWTGNGYSSGLPTTSSGTVSPVYGTSTATAVFAPVTNALPTNYTVLPIVSNAGTTGPKPINSSGQVAALSFSYPTISAVRWLPSSVNGTVGSLQDLGTLPLTGWSGTTSINDAGQIAGLNGANYPSVGKIVIWTPTAGGGGNVAIIADAQGSPALNNYGQAGASGLIWTPVSANAGTGTLTTGSQFTNLIAMNGFGQAVLNPTGYPAISASLFTPSSAHGTAGTFTSITGLAGSSQTSLVAINENGAVLGYSCFSQLNGNCLNQAFLWIPASTNSTSGVISQIALPNGFVSMTPAAINDNGDVVGTMLQTSGTAVPFLYSKGNVYDLTTASALLVGASATGINNSGQIVLNGNAVYLATPAKAAATLVSITISSSPSGIPFQTDGGSYSTPATFQWQSFSTHNVSFAQSATVGGGRVGFIGWSDGQPLPSRLITVPQNGASYLASFVLQYPLTLQLAPPSGGLLLANPFSPDGYYNLGTNVQVTAIPNSAYQFTGFTGDLSGAANGQKIVMASAKSITANFAPVQNPNILASVRNDVSRAAQPGPAVTVVIQLTNNGTGIGKGVQITGITAREIAPVPASLTVTKTLPVNVGDLSASASSGAIQVPVSVPSTATRIVLGVTGTVQNSAGQLFSFSTSLTVLR